MKEIHMDKIDILDQTSNVHCNFQLGMGDRFGHTTQTCEEIYLET